MADRPHFFILSCSLASLVCTHSYTHNIHVSRTQLSEALENLYRRPEDHNSFEQNIEATAAHAAVPLRAVAL